MVNRIWSASGIRLPELSKQERERPAVLRVNVLATDPTAERLHVRRLDVIALVAAVDRMTQGPRVDALMVVDKATITGALFAGSMQVRQSIWRVRVGRTRRHAP